MELIDNPWRDRIVAIVGWYHVYMRSPLMHRCIGPDVFKLILAYLDVVNLRYPLAARTRYDVMFKLWLGYRDGAYLWVGSTSPCHVCMKPCEYTGILCKDHAIHMPECRCCQSNLTKMCTGDTQVCRRSLYHTALKCNEHVAPTGQLLCLDECFTTGHCSVNHTLMSAACAKKIRRVILPK